ncbi:MAG: YebC/PmpR family DNA-binding transcriptional regulator [Lachnospiraceae bacterium]
MLALDAGAEDFSEEEDSYEVYTAPEDSVQFVKLWRREAVSEYCGADVTMIHKATWTELTDEESIKKNEAAPRNIGR